MITQIKKDTLRQQDALSKNTYSPKHDAGNAHSLPAKCKAWVIALALAGRISYTTATRIIHWLGVAHV